MYNGNEGKCFGRWDIKDSACAKCWTLVREKCEKITKKKKIKEEGELVEKALSDADKRNDVNDYFFGVLQIKLGIPVSQWQGSENLNDQISTYFYYGPDGKKVLAFIACKVKTGMLKVTVPSRIKKVVGLESVEQADELVKEIVGG